jgi:hypothetical protein
MRSAASGHAHNLGHNDSNFYVAYGARWRDVDSATRATFTYDRHGDSGTVFTFTFTMVTMEPWHVFGRSAGLPSLLSKMTRKDVVCILSIMHQQLDAQVDSLAGAH